MHNVLTVLVLVLLCPLASLAQAASSGPADVPKEGFRAEYLADLAGLEKKFVSLAGAVPQEKYEWRPEEGVRSFSEVFLHVANTNYTFPRMVGIAPPEGVDLQGMQASTIDRARIAEMLKASFAHARQGVSGLTDAEVEAGMGNLAGWTRRRALVYQLRHASEHLGQLIAYARVNGITPPWTEAAQRRLVTFDSLPAPMEVVSRNWTILLEDPAGDGDRASSADGKSLSYDYDAAEDMLWFRLELHGPVDPETPAVSITIDTDADQGTGRSWYGSNSKFTYEKILNLGVLEKTDGGSKVQGYNGITTETGAAARNWLDHKKSNLTFYTDAATQAYFLGVKRADIDPNLQKFNLIGSVGSKALWNDDIGNDGFATIELELPD